MRPVTLMARCRWRGIRLEPRAGGGLHYRAPAGALTPRLRTALVDAKPALLDLLREPARRLAATVATRLREVVLEYDDLEGGDRKSVV